MDSEERAAYLAAMCEALETAGVSVGELGKTVRLGLAGSVAGPERLAELCTGLHTAILEVARAAEEAHGIEAWLGCLRAGTPDEALAKLWTGAPDGPEFEAETGAEYRKRSAERHAREDRVYREGAGRRKRAPSMSGGTGGDPEPSEHLPDEGVASSAEVRARHMESVGSLDPEEAQRLRRLLDEEEERERVRRFQTAGRRRYHWHGVTTPLLAALVEKQPRLGPFGLLSRSSSGEWTVAVVTSIELGATEQFWREAPASWRPFEFDAVPWAVIRFEVGPRPGEVRGVPSLDMGPNEVVLPGQDDQGGLLSAVVEVLAAGGAVGDFLALARLELLPDDLSLPNLEPCPECGYVNPNGPPCPECGEDVA